MNIFVLDDNIERCAAYHCDKHVVKMTLETAQLLCSPFEQGDAPYKRTHYNHPCAKWARESVGNYEWLLELGYRLAEEYTHRYGKMHKCLDVIDWCDNNSHTLNLPDLGLTPWAQAMPDEYKSQCAIQAYRNYYCGDKLEFCTWKNRQLPNWWPYDLVT
tara:strand:- start:78 stop:554 length:477 start_codon:yes stop_codon:yes gene_type:complete